MWSYVGKTGHVSDDIPRRRRVRKWLSRGNDIGAEINRLSGREKRRAVVELDRNAITDIEAKRALNGERVFVAEDLKAGAKSWTKAARARNGLRERGLHAKEYIGLSWAWLRDGLIVPAASYEILWLAFLEGLVTNNDVVPLLLGILGANGEPASVTNPVPATGFVP